MVHHMNLFMDEYQTPWMLMSATFTKCSKKGIVRKQKMVNVSRTRFSIFHMHASMWVLNCYLQISYVSLPCTTDPTSPSPLPLFFGVETTFSDF